MTPEQALLAANNDPAWVTAALRTMDEAGLVVTVDKTPEDVQAKLDRVAAQAASDTWVTLQHHYRQSRADPPEFSIGCVWAIESLRTLADEVGRPDPRAVVEVGMEHLWQMVYDEPYPSAPEDPAYFGDEGFEMVRRNASTMHRRHVHITKRPGPEATP